MPKFDDVVASVCYRDETIIMRRADGQRGASGRLIRVDTLSKLQYESVIDVSPNWLVSARSFFSNCSRLNEKDRHLAQRVDSLNQHS